MASEPLRFSRLKLMSRSAAHYAAAEVQTTSAMEVGTAADRLLLGGGPVLGYPGAVRRGKDYDAFCAANPDALILTQKDADKAHGIAEAVFAVPDARRLLLGFRQDTMRWTMSSRACRGTPDVRGDRFLTDLKTGETSDPRQFLWKVKRFAYHAQLAFYRHGARICGYEIDECYIVAVEQAPPHVVTVFRLTEHLLEMGDRLWRLWFEQLQVCEASGQFPPYSQSVVELDVADGEDIIDLGEAVEIEEYRPVASRNVPGIGVNDEGGSRNG